MECPNDDENRESDNKAPPASVTEQFLAKCQLEETQRRRKPRGAFGVPGGRRSLYFKTVTADYDAMDTTKQDVILKRSKPCIVSSDDEASLQSEVPMNPATLFKYQSSPMVKRSPIRPRFDDSREPPAAKEEPEGAPSFTELLKQALAVGKITPA